MTPNVQLTAAQFRSALDGLLEGVQIIDRDLRYVYVNPAAAAQGRQTVAGVVGRKLTEVFPGSEDSEYLRALREVLASGEPQRLTTDFSLPDGSVGRFELNVEPVEDGVFVLSIETTGRRDAEAALSDALERYRALLDGLPDFVFLLDRRGTVLDAHVPTPSRAMVDAGRIVGKSMFALLPPALAALAQDALARALASGQPQALQYEFRMPDGLHHFETAVVPGAGDRVTVVARDVTERIRLEQQLRQAQKMEAVGQLTGGIAHDFNNLLQIITANADLLSAAADEGATPSAELADIVEAARRGVEMVAQLMQFGRRDAAARALVDPAAVLQRLSGMLRRLLPASVRLEVGALPTGVTLSLDSGALEQIVTNLCTNACDAMPSGGRIRISGRVVPLGSALAARFPWLAPGEYLSLRIADSGVGMSEETLQRVFEPFFTTKEVGAGTGLGMAMVYGLMRAHRGAVEVRSAVGEGTEVHLLFPVVAAPLASDAQSLSPAAQRVEGGRETLLLVEDDAAVRAAMRRVLELKGYRVLEAADGAAGLALFRTHRETVRLVISDLLMPQLGGRAMADAIRAEAPGMPLLFSSGFTGREVDGTGQVGPDVHFLPKPWKLNDLLRAVRGALDGAAD